MCSVASKMASLANSPAPNRRNDQKRVWPAIVSEGKFRATNRRIQFRVPAIPKISDGNIEIKPGDRTKLLLLGFPVSFGLDGSLHIPAH